MIKNATYRMLMRSSSLAAIVTRSIDQLPGMMTKKPFSWHSKEEQDRLFRQHARESILAMGGDGTNGYGGRGSAKTEIIDATYSVVA